jgi:hypothetical protein
VQLLEDQQLLYVVVAHKTKKKKKSLHGKLKYGGCLVAVSASVLSLLEQLLPAAKCPMISHSSESSSKASSNTSALHKLPPPARLNFFQLKVQARQSADRVTYQFEQNSLLWSNVITRPVTNPR